MKKEEKVTYLVERSDGSRFKITVPEDWKVTFGPAVTSQSKNPHLPQYAGKIPMALRFYESETKQRAIFTNVVSFRDISIPLFIEKINLQEKDGYYECDGVRKATTFQAKTREWKDANEEETIPLLPGDEEIFK